MTSSVILRMTMDGCFALGLSACGAPSSLVAWALWWWACVGCCCGVPAVLGPPMLCWAVAPARGTSVSGLSASRSNILMGGGPALANASRAVCVFGDHICRL